MPNNRILAAPPARTPSRAHFRDEPSELPPLFDSEISGVGDLEIVAHSNRYDEDDQSTAIGTKPYPKQGALTSEHHFDQEWDNEPLEDDEWDGVAEADYTSDRTQSPDLTIQSQQESLHDESRELPHAGRQQQPPHAGRQQQSPPSGPLQQQSLPSHSLQPSLPGRPHRDDLSLSEMRQPAYPNDVLGRTGSSPRIQNEEHRQFGKLAPLMQDPNVEEIWINSPNRIFVAQNGISHLTPIVMSTAEVKDLIERLLMWGGRRLDLSNPFVDARLPDGSRLHVAIPEITATHWAVNIRKHLMKSKSLNALTNLGVMSIEVEEFLTRAVLAGKNILVSGSTQAGKTTLLNSLVGSLPPSSRVITIEEVFELKPNLPDCVALQTRAANLQGDGEIPLRKLIKEALRMRPSHLVVGEIREAESLDLLIALNSGLPGMGTIHANSGRDALSKLQTLPLLAGSNISHDFIAPMVASCIDLVVHTSIVQNHADGELDEWRGSEKSRAANAQAQSRESKSSSSRSAGLSGNRKPGLAELRRPGAADHRTRGSFEPKEQGLFSSRAQGSSGIESAGQVNPIGRGNRGGELSRGNRGSELSRGNRGGGLNGSENRGRSHTNAGYRMDSADLHDDSLERSAEAKRLARLEAIYRRENSLESDESLDGLSAEWAPGRNTANLGSRRITEILHVTGRIENRRVESEVVFAFDGENYQRGLVSPDAILMNQSSSGSGGKE